MNLPLDDEGFIKITLKDVIDALTALHPEPGEVLVGLDKDGWDAEEIYNYLKDKRGIENPTVAQIIMGRGVFEFHKDLWDTGPYLCINN